MHHTFDCIDFFEDGIEFITDHIKGGILCVKKNYFTLMETPLRFGPQGRNSSLGLTLSFLCQNPHHFHKLTKQLVFLQFLTFYQENDI
jgi:hypothetical protein